VAIVPLRELGGGENLLGTYIAETLTNSFCTHRGTTVDCELSVTALDDDAQINVSRQSRLVDAHGNETETSFLSFSGGDSNRARVRVGGSSLAGPGSLELVRGVAHTGHLRFEGVEAAGGQVPLIEIRFSMGSYGFGGNGRIQFRNVRVK
jgi:hypothetical protein